MAEKATNLAAATLGVFVAVGLAAGGYFISTTLYKGRLASNTVTVKGFAERDVKADLALWQISYSKTGGNLSDLYSQSTRDEAALVEFLAKQGFKTEDIKPGQLQINDQFANNYRPNGVSEGQRYILRNAISVRSEDVGLVDQSRRALNDVIKQGIALTSNNVEFQFTKLNDIKAPMLRAATQNAREAAQQFANDAESRVGSIQSANQGFFSIVSSDSAAAQNPDGGSSYSPYQQSTIDKKVRVVVTLTYYLDK